MEGSTASPRRWIIKEPFFVPALHFPLSLIYNCLVGWEKAPKGVLHGTELYSPFHSCS